MNEESPIKITQSDIQEALTIAQLLKKGEINLKEFKDRVSKLNLII